MKGYCPVCDEKIIDEVEFSQFGMCIKCYKYKKERGKKIGKEEN